MKSSPYVYPYTPFSDLANRAKTSTFANPEKVTLDELRAIAKELPQPAVVSTGDTVAERILSIFLDDRIRFGDLALIEDCRDFWLKKLDRFISTNNPLVFTLLGFPFKVPVPFKTDRRLPDMGEVLILARLAHIAALIKKEYTPGARIVIFTEGAFGHSVGISDDEANAYAARLNYFVGALGYEDVMEIRALSEMEAAPDFSDRFAKKISELKELFSSGDVDFKKAYDGAYVSISRIVSTREVPQELLFEVYNESSEDAALSPEARSVREDIRAKAQEAVIQYHAYLKVRDDLGFLENAVPDALALSVSPKPFRLGIQPIAEQCVRLPYHAVPVLNQDNLFTLEYLVDIWRDGRTYMPMMLEGDPDSAPFFYKVA